MPREHRNEESQPVEVELFVCPDPGCRQVGKLHVGQGAWKAFCMGPMTARHKKVKMEKRRFVEAQ